MITGDLHPNLVFVGLALTGAYLALDFFATEGKILSGMEEPVNLAAIALLLSAYVIKHRETSLAGAIGRPPLVGGSTSASGSG